MIYSPLTKDFCAGKFATDRWLSLTTECGTTWVASATTKLSTAMSRPAISCRTPFIRKRWDSAGFVVRERGTPALLQLNDHSN